MTTYFLDFVKNKNKISYAASFGKDIFEGNNIDTLRCLSLLKQFYNVSVRENDAVDICKKQFDVEAEVLLDSTLLLSKEDYEKLIEEEYNEKIDVAVYFVMDHDNKIIKNKNFKRLFPHQNIINIKGEYKEKPFGRIFVYNSISKWLDGIRKAKYVVTDSYHGLLFSLIFNKKVICIGRNSASFSRFQTLIENLNGNIDKIIYKSLNEVKNVRCPLKYNEINKNISTAQKKSIDFLKDNLGPNKVKEINKVLDNVNQNFKEIMIDNIKLKEKYNCYKDEYYKVINSRSWKLTRVIRKIKRRIKRK